MQLIGRNCIKECKHNSLTTDLLITTGLASMAESLGPVSISMPNNFHLDTEASFDNNWANEILGDWNMDVAKCKNCGGKLTKATPESNWKHHSSFPISVLDPIITCPSAEPGLGLSETVKIYYERPELYATWARNQISKYTHNAILQGLRMQATIHWNNCSHAACKNCEAVGATTADAYMTSLANGRIDLHPDQDDEVHTLAFEIHNKEVAAGTHIPARGKPGIMTCSYVSGAGSSEACDCYNKAYKQWINKAEEKVLRSIPIDPDDLYYEPRFE